MENLEVLTSLVLKNWKEEMSRLPTPDTREILSSEVVEMVEEIIHALFLAAEEEEVCESFTSYGKCYRYGEDLGRLRRRQKFDIGDLVMEHFVLRNEFWEVFRERVGLDKMVDFQLERRINECFDNLLMASAKSFHYEYSREVRENPLRDPLSGLFNYDFFQGRLGEELRRAIRYHHEVTLVLFEVENYYALQEVEGREKLDEMIRFIGRNLERMVREVDVVARVGDCAFAILLPETGQQGGKVMSGRLSAFFSKELPALTASKAAPELRWGLASYPQEVEVPEMLYDCAMKAMLRARGETQDRVVVYRSAEMG